jgi:hypothetical protein
VYGDFKAVDPDNDKVLGFLRGSKEHRSILVLCNFSGGKVDYHLSSEIHSRKRTLLLGNYVHERKSEEGDRILLDAWDGRVYSLEK